MREFKASTKRGQQILDMASRCYARSLNQLYDRWSQAKQEAFDWCWNQYINDEDSECFGIGNANTFGFTASWVCKIHGEDAVRVETKDNSYVVFLDR